MDMEIDIELLIHAVEQRPGLRDLADPVYADRDQRKAQWDEACNVFTLDDNSAQDKNELGQFYLRWKTMSVFFLLEQFYLIAVVCR